jgi:hypothetical protein
MPRRCTPQSEASGYEIVTVTLRRTEIDEA